MPDRDMGGPKCEYEEHLHNRIINMLYQIFGEKY